MITTYLIIVNLLALILFGYDKQCAVTHRWRVPEKTLLVSAAVGGSLGAYIGMITFRHKTQKTLFQILIPILLTIQTIILLIIL